MTVVAHVVHVSSARLSNRMGAPATGIALSTWLLAFGLFFFLSLAFVKRYSEVIASAGWDQRIELEETVRSRLGNDCDVLVFTAPRFRQLAASGEPVVADILADGIALVGSMPRLSRRVG